MGKTANSKILLDLIDEDKPVLSIIIPTYNERENIIELITKLEEIFNTINLEIIIVDDGKDGTANAAEKLNAMYDNIKVYKRNNKLGLSSAVLYGFNKANGNILAVMDADMQHPPEVLLNMYNKFCDGYDLAVASRYVEGGKIKKWKVSRVLFSRGATILSHLFLARSRKVNDVMSGCFMIKRVALNGSTLNPIGFKILLEIIIKCDFRNVIEVPYTFINRRNGKSNLSANEIKLYMVHLNRLFFYSISHPTQD